MICSLSNWSTRAAMLRADEKGTEVIEYALLLGMIVCACLFMLAALGNKVVARWTKINDFLDVGS